MPSWSQIHAQLRHPANPVVFFDISVGTTVGIATRSLVTDLYNSIFVGYWANDIRIVR